MAQTQGKAYSIPLAILLLGIVTQAHASLIRPDGFGTNITPGILAQGSGSDPIASETLFQGVQIVDRWTNDPRCLSVYLDAPSWMHYNINVTLKLDPTFPDPGGQIQQCLNNNVRWRAVVSGVDYLPRPLAVAVGYGSRFMYSNFTTKAEYEQTPLGLDEGDYTDAAPSPAFNSTDLTGLFKETATCVVIANGLQAAGFNNVVVRQKFFECLQQNIPANPPPPPMPPPPPPPPRRGRIRRANADVRKQFNLAPFLRGVANLASKFPYNFNNKSDELTVTAQRHATYVMPNGSCDAGFADSQFDSFPITQTTQEFDSCYYTQTIVYIYYDGGCFNGTADPNLFLPGSFPVQIEMDATYSEYHNCGKSVLISLNLAVKILVIVTSIPAALFVFFLGFPTIWRMMYRGVLLIRLLFMTKSKADTKRKHRLRIDADIPLRWGCLLRFQAMPFVSYILLVRKRILYACLTVKKPTGRCRRLMIMVIAACATSVSVMVWRPYINVILNSNPTRITLQLETTAGKYNALLRYFQIVAVSLFVGCLAYMSMITATNFPDEEDVKRYVLRHYDRNLPEQPPGSIAKQPEKSDLPRAQAAAAAAAAHLELEPEKQRRIVQWARGLALKSDTWTPWAIQKTISACFTMYLLFWLSLHITNIAVFLRVTQDRAAFTWICIVQFFNIFMIAVLRVYDMKLVEHEACQKYLGEDIPPPKGIIWGIIRFVWWITFRNYRKQLRVKAALKFAAKEKLKNSSNNNPYPSNKSKPGDVEAQDSHNRLGHHNSVDGKVSLSLAAASHGKSDAGVTNNQNAKKRKGRKNALLHWWRNDDALRRQAVKTGDKKKDRQAWRRIEDAEEELSLFQQLKTIWIETFQEEYITFILPPSKPKPDPKAKHSRSGQKPTPGPVVAPEQEGQVITAATFKYPAWFLAAVLVAFYMLIFHYIKALGFGKKLGNCVVSWSTCDITWIRNFATTYSFDQLGVIKSAAIQMQETLESLGAGQLVLDRLLFAVGTNYNTQSIMNVLNEIEVATTAGNSARAIWVRQFGERLQAVSTFGYTLGLALGFVTLIIAVASFKRISKANRLLRLSRKILVARQQQAQEAQAVLQEAQAMLEKVKDTGDTTILTTMLPTALGGASMRRRGPSHAPKTYANDITDLSVTTTVMADINGLTALPPGALRDAKRQASMHRRAGDLDVYADDDDSDYSDDEGVSLFKEDDVKEPEVASVTALAAVRACNAKIGTVVFFLGVLLSSSVVQLYVVGIVLSAAAAFILHPHFWNLVLAYWTYIAVAVLVLVLNQAVMAGLIGNMYLSTGRRIKRPAGWMAFMIIASITNLVTGLFIAIIRLVWLVLTTIFTVGLLDRTILVVGSALDTSHQSFLAGVNLQDWGGKVDVRSFKPGATWRSVRRWQAAAKQIAILKQEGFDELVARNVALANSRATFQGGPSTVHSSRPAHSQSIPLQPMHSDARSAYAGHKPAAPSAPPPLNPASLLPASLPQSHVSGAPRPPSNPASRSGNFYQSHGQGTPPMYGTPQYNQPPYPPYNPFPSSVSAQSNNSRSSSRSQPGSGMNPRLAMPPSQGAGNQPNQASQSRDARRPPGQQPSGTPAGPTSDGGYFDYMAPNRSTKR